jgi:hypothetical protein
MTGLLRARGASLDPTENPNVNPLLKVKKNVKEMLPGVNEGTALHSNPVRSFP